LTNKESKNQHKLDGTEQDVASKKIQEVSEDDVTKEKIQEVSPNDRSAASKST